MVGWPHGGPPSAATKQKPTGPLVSLRIMVEQNGAGRPGQQSLIFCFAPSPSCCQMSCMQLLAALSPLLELCEEARTAAPICSHMNAKLENAPCERCPSQGASWNNCLHCCPTFLTGAGDMSQPASSSWPGVMQGPGAGQTGAVSVVVPVFIWPWFLGDTIGYRRGSAPG